MNKRLRILVVEDSLVDSMPLLREFERAGYALEWECVETAPAVEKARRDAAWDLILADRRLPCLGAPAGDSSGRKQVVEESRQHREALRESERRLRTLMENLPGVAYRCAYDDAWTLEFTGGRHQDLTGRAGEGVVSFAEIIHPEDLERVRMEVREAVEAGKAFESAYRIIDGNGRIRHVEDYGQGIYDDEGRVVALEGFAIDVTERHRLREQLNQAQKMEAVGRLAGGVAHDFNNILTTILGVSEFLLQDLPADSPQRDDVQDIRRAADRAVGLIRQLLAFSRKQVMQPEVLDLNAVVREAEKMLRRLIGEDIEFRIVLDPNLGAVKGDPGQVEQILMNLVVNARAVKVGGWIWGVGVRV